MSVSLLVKDTKDAQQRLVPVATEAIFKLKWLPGAQDLCLEWVALMGTGFDVTSDNRNVLLEELGHLRGWMGRRGETDELERLDRLAAEVGAIRFETGATAFLG